MPVAEIAAEARRRGIEIWARGSAVGSLVVHAPGISPIDPREHGLLFERFLNELRPKLPDVDLHVQSDRRDELLAWVHTRFQHVAMVATYQIYQLRSALRDGLRAFGVDPEPYLRRIPPEGIEPRLENILPPAYRTPIAKLIGKPQHLSVHPGGVVIGPGPLEDLVPLQMAPKGVLFTQYDLVSVEAAGLIKIDLLGNRTLRELADCDSPNPPEGDPATLKLLAGGDTVGCFQLEPCGARSAAPYADPRPERPHPCARHRATRPRRGGGLAPLRADLYPWAHERVLQGLPAPTAIRSDEPVGLYAGLVRARNQLRFLEPCAGPHSMEPLREEARRAGCVSTSEVVEGKRARLAAVVAAARTVNERVQFVTWEDEKGLLESLVLHKRVDNPGPYLVEGTLRDDVFRVHKLGPFYERTCESGT